MKRTITLVSFMALLISMALNSIAASAQETVTKSSTSKTPEQIYKEADYVVKIEAIESSSAVFFGSGSVIPCKKYKYCVLSAYHIAGSTETAIYAHFKNNSPPQKLKFIGGSEEYDFALLNFADPKFEPKSAAIIGKSSSLETGAKIMSIGCTAYGDFWFSADGYLYTAIRPVPERLQHEFLAAKMLRPPNIMIIKINFFRGYSGGPLLNSKGELIGIVSATQLLDVHFLGIGIPIDDISKEIEKILK
jgi:S1-C subfamily serine protease